jgi:hypothetical protein
LPSSGRDTVGVKCGKGRAEADEWIEEFPDEVTVSPYIGRHGWNVLRIGGAIPVEALVEAIDTSYDLVVATLPKSPAPLTSTSPGNRLRELPADGLVLCPSRHPFEQISHGDTGIPVVGCELCSRGSGVSAEGGPTPSGRRSVGRRMSPTERLCFRGGWAHSVRQAISWTKDESN